MKYVVSIFLLLTVLSCGFCFYRNYQKINLGEMVNPMGIGGESREGEYTKYDFDSLKKRGGIVGDIKIGEKLKLIDQKRGETCLKSDKISKIQCQLDKKFITKEMSFISNGKTVSGMINYFDDGQKHPVIVMIRGFADNEGYYIGSGSWKPADQFAQNGYVTVSLDFLGFGDSDSESRDILEARFEKVDTVLDLIESIKKLDFVDPEKIGIWAHSNGGQIALSVLEISGGNYPTSLWAPMTNPFPQSVLDTAGNDENGQKVKNKISNFEKEYDSRRYAFENYYGWIKAPVQIHQGTGDVWCDVDWQKKVIEGIKSFNKEANLFVYNGDDHNLKNNWDVVISRDLGFYNDALLKK